MRNRNVKTVVHGTRNFFKLAPPQSLRDVEDRSGERETGRPVGHCRQEGGHEGGATWEQAEAWR